MEFRFKGIDNEGRVTKGVAYAPSEAAFYEELDRRGLQCLEYSTKGRGNVSYKYKLKELSVFCKQLSIMLNSGVEILKAFELLAERTKNLKEQQVYLYIAESLTKGVSLSKAMRDLGKTFPAVLTSMVVAGESSGSLDTVMMKMSVYYEKEAATRSKVQSAMMYPIILLVVLVIVVIALFTAVLPNFFATFEGQELPFVTRILISISEFVTNNSLLLIISAIVIVFACVMFSALPVGRRCIDTAKCTMPVIGKLLDMTYVSRYANTMFILLSTNVPIIQSLNICSDVLDNVYLKDKFKMVETDVEMGRPVSTSLENHAIFDSMVWTMLAVAEETSQVTEVYEKLADYYEKEAAEAISKILALLEPLMLIFIGGIVGIVMAAVMLPMYSMSF